MHQYMVTSVKQGRPEDDKEAPDGAPQKMTPEEREARQKVLDALDEFRNKFPKTPESKSRGW